MPAYSPQQQNNMNQYQPPHSPTYQHQQLFSKNNRLYQQLLQDDYLTDNVYSQSKPIMSHAAHIKFNTPPSNPIKINREPQYISQRDFSPRLPKTSNLFKGFQPSVGRISNHATQSLSSNYCITEHQNQENSTVNLYSLSRNHIEPDLEFSSNNITAKINEEDDQSNANEQISKNENVLLEGSILHDKSSKHEDSLIEGEKIKKYRSEEYSHPAFNLVQTIQEDDSGKMPKVLVEKYLKNDISRKFSGSQNSEHQVQSNFKTVLNEVHIVPYKINNQVKPYAFSVPIENKQYNPNNTVASSIQQQQRKNNKANSLNLKNSNHNSQREIEEEMATAPARHLYFSNHPHLQNRVAPHFVVNQQQSEAKVRASPKSEPKYNHTNDKNTRSNSIQCKSKPNIHSNRDFTSYEDLKNPQTQRQHLEQSQVTNIFKNKSQPQPQEQNNPNDSSVIYESTGINICCNLTKQNEPQPNKINFMRPKEDHKVKPQQISPFFCSSIDMTKVAILQTPKGSYKINPIQMIREMSESQGQKGIKLVGFPKKDRY